MTDIEKFKQRAERIRAIEARKLPTAVIDQMRELHEGPEKLGYKRLAHMFNVPWNTVKSICTYRRRCWN